MKYLTYSCETFFFFSVLNPALTHHLILMDYSSPPRVSGYLDHKLQRWSCSVLPLSAETKPMLTSRSVFLIVLSRRLCVPHLLRPRVSHQSPERPPRTEDAARGEFLLLTDSRSFRRTTVSIQNQKCMFFCFFFKKERNQWEINQ